MRIGYNEFSIELKHWAQVTQLIFLVSIVFFTDEPAVVLLVLLCILMAMIRAFCAVRQIQDEIKMSNIKQQLELMALQTINDILECETISEIFERIKIFNYQSKNLSEKLNKFLGECDGR